MNISNNLCVASYDRVVNFDGSVRLQSILLVFDRNYVKLNYLVNDLRDEVVVDVNLYVYIAEKPAFLRNKKFTFPGDIFEDDIKSTDMSVEVRDTCTHIVGTYDLDSIKESHVWFLANSIRYHD